MKKLLNLLLVVLLLPLGSCEKEEEGYVGTYKIVVASEKRMANIHPSPFGYYYASCLMIKSKDIYYESEKWHPFNDKAISGFEYEEGYEYILLVKAYVDKEVMDSGTDYRLYKIFSKEKKNSIGLPDDETDQTTHN